MTVPPSSLEHPVFRLEIYWPIASVRKMQTFSMILPILGDTGMFEDTVASVLRHRPAGTQIIVVHDGDYEDVYDLAGDQVEFVTINKRAKLIRLFNAGVKRAKGDIVGFLRPGAELNEGWHRAVLDAFYDSEVGSVSPVIVKRGSSRVAVAAGVDCGLGFRRKLAGRGKSVRSIKPDRLDLYGPTSWAGFYRRDLLSVLFQETGPVDENLDQNYLDLELGLSFRTMGYDCESCPQCVVSISKPGRIAREARKPHGLSAHRAFIRHVLHIGSTSHALHRYWTIAMEVLSSPLQPWKLRHAMQRNCTGPSRLADEDFSGDISVAARKLALAFEDSGDHQESDALQFEAAQREAATFASEKRRRAA